MKQVIKTLLVYSVLVVLVDSVYLSWVAGPFGKMIKKIQGSPMKMKLPAAIVVYLALVCVWYVFIYSHLQDFSFRDNIVRAMILGICIYSIYDFTNLALIDGIRLDLAILDSLWGGILFATTTALFLGGRKLIATL